MCKWGSQLDCMNASFRLQSLVRHPGCRSSCRVPTSAIVRKGVMVTAVPRELVGASETVESLPDKEDKLWELFEDGREVLACIEDLSLGKTVLCPLEGSAY